MTIAGIIALFISGLLLLQSGWAFFVSLGYREGKVVHADAWLSPPEAEPSRPARLLYTYTVDGRCYTLENNASEPATEEPSNCLRVVYQRKHPDRAYLEHTTLPTELVECAALGFIGLILLMNGIVFLRL